MTSPAGGGVRLLRTFVLAAATLGLAAAAHRLGGGELPGAVALAVLLAACLVPTAWLTGRRVRLPALLTLLAPLEWGLHEALMALASNDGGAAPIHHHGVPLATTALGTGGSADLPAQTAVPVMLLAHMVATLLTAGALTHAERALWALWEALRPALLAPPTLRLPAPAPLVRAVAAVPVARPAHGRPCPRGPPIGR